MYNSDTVRNPDGHNYVSVGCGNILWHDVPRNIFSIDYDRSGLSQSFVMDWSSTNDFCDNWRLDGSFGIHDTVCRIFGHWSDPAQSLQGVGIKSRWKNFMCGGKWQSVIKKILKKLIWFHKFFSVHGNNISSENRMDTDSLLPGHHDICLYNILEDVL